MAAANRWIFFVSFRFGKVDSRGHGAPTGILSAGGIAFGALSLIVILSVMNGFQMGYIDNILEVSSAHVRITGSVVQADDIKGAPYVQAAIPFGEAQALVSGKWGRQSGSLVRALPTSVLQDDTGFAQSIRVIKGSFDITSPYSVVCTRELARQLSISVGDELTLVAVSGGSDVDLFPTAKPLTVTGIVQTGYYEIDSSFTFISLHTAEALSIISDDGPRSLLIKLSDPEKDRHFTSWLESTFPGTPHQSWRVTNRAFFGALRNEKNILLLLVVLIFLVVAVNIHNAMRRSIYERREEIALMQALGSRPSQIQALFTLNGFFTGFSGAFIGLISGLLLSVRINGVFTLTESLINHVNHFLAALLHRGDDSTFSLFNPDYFYLTEIPTRIIFSEVLFVFIFGVLSATLASWKASGAITKMKSSEVLRYE